MDEYSLPIGIGGFFGVCVNEVIMSMVYCAIPAEDVLVAMNVIKWIHFESN